jgi:hypothetical protein
MRFRSYHSARCPENSKGWGRLGIIEHAEELVGHRGQCAFGAPSRLTPARTGFDPCFIRVLLCGLGEGTEDGQPLGALGLGQAGEGFPLTIVSDVSTHRLAPSLVFLRIASLILY